MYLNEILPGNWREDEWPEHIEVSHESSRFKSRRYVPRVNSANKSSANPVDGIWCSHCGWAGVIAQDMTDLDEVTEPQFDILAEDIEELRGQREGKGVPQPTAGEELCPVPRR